MLALLPHLAPETLFEEPCAGDGALLDVLVAAGHRCIGAHDIRPRRADIVRENALRLKWKRLPAGAIFITNPPWTRRILHALIAHLARRRPVWLLFDADWVHTYQAVPFLPMLRKIVSVGRVSWFPETGATGKDNAAWYLFDGTREPGPIEFIGRVHVDEPKAKGRKGKRVQRHGRRKIVDKAAERPAKGATAREAVG